MSNEPHEFVEHLLGLPAPTVSLPWTTYADMHDGLGPAANTSLADLAARDTLVVYFYPSDDEREGFAANTMSRVYRNNNGGITQLGARTIGVSTETALHQQELAASELFPQMLLSDEKAQVAKDLDLPTVIIDDRDEYEPLTVVIRDGKIAYVAYTYPGASPSEYAEHILCWLAENEQKKSGARKGTAA
jgi:peroxiredoxin